MKKRTLLLAVLAVLLVLSSSIGSAVAYFHTYVSARGGYVIWGGRTEIEEDYVNGYKVVQISNVARTAEDNGKYPIFVRAHVFYDSGLEITYNCDPAGSWVENGEYWYYQSVLSAGDTSGKLEIMVKAASGQNYKIGDTADVIVVYETVPALFTSDGTADLEASWASEDIHVINT